MRVAIITESFPPDVNGVAHCVLRVAENLVARGHQPLVVAPQPPRSTHARSGAKDPASSPWPVVRVPSVPLPGYRSFRLGLPSHRLYDALVGHRTEVVHLASPVVLGAHGAAVAGRLGLPVVAVYQTDLPSYARAYRLGQAGEAFAWRWLRGTVYGHRDRPARPRHRQRVAVGPWGGHGPLRSGPAKRADPDSAGAGR